MISCGQLPLKALACSLARQKARQPMQILIEAIDNARRGMRHACRAFRAVSWWTCGHDTPA